MTSNRNYLETVKIQVFRYGLWFLLAVQTLLLLANNFCSAPTWDEWGHLPSGLCHLQYGRFEPYRVNPPLIRILAAFPVYLAGGELPWTVFSDVPGGRPEWTLAKAYVEEHGRDCFFYFWLARVAIMPFALLGTCVIWKWWEHRGHPNAALVSATLWVFSPNVLGSAATITTDVPAASLGLLTSVLYFGWLQTPSWIRLIGWASSLGLTLLCKFSWIIFPPLLLIIWVLQLRKHNQFCGGSQALQFLSATGVVWLMIGSAYQFEGVGIPLKDYDFVSNALSGLPPHNSGVLNANRFRDTWLGEIPVPLPEDLVLGIDTQKKDFEAGWTSYLWGHRRNEGWYHYYLVGLLVKEPFPLWMLCVASVVVVIQRGRFQERLPEVIVAVPGIAMLVFVSSQTGFNHHLRYVLPFLPVVYGFASLGLVEETETNRSRWFPRLQLVLVLAYISCSVSVLPRSYTYFSYAAGGPVEGWRYLDNSNVDWGQDLISLERWAEKHPEAMPIYTLYSIDHLDLSKLDLSVVSGNEFLSPPSKNGMRVPTRSGMWVVFSSVLTAPDGRWFRDKVPVELISPAVRVYSVDAQSIPSLNRGSIPYVTGVGEDQLSNLMF